MNPETHVDAQQQQLFGLMAVAEEQQKAVQAALQGLTEETAALAKERAAVTRAAASVATVASDVKRAAADAIPAMQRAAGEAVGASVRRSLADASEVAAKALGEAAKPVLASLSGVVQAASEVEGSMRSAGAWFAWKWVAVAAGGLAGVCLVTYAALWWQMYEFTSVSDQKAALEIEVTQLRANVAALAKKGGRVVMRTCGGRLCIEADPDQDKGWVNKDTGVGLVIPKGY